MDAPHSLVGAAISTSRRQLVDIAQLMCKSIRPIGVSSVVSRYERTVGQLQKSHKLTDERNGALDQVIGLLGSLGCNRPASCKSVYDRSVDAGRECFCSVTTPRASFTGAIAPLRKNLRRLPTKGHRGCKAATQSNLNEARCPLARALRLRSAGQGAATALIVP